MNRRPDDSGMTLIELLVAMVLTAIVFTLVARITIVATNGMLTVAGSAAAQTSGRNLLESALVQLQGAQPRGYCSGAPAGPATAAITTASTSTRCHGIGYGPPSNIWLVGGEPTGAPLPPAPPGCPTPTAGGPAALVVAGTSCIGFYSYEYEGGLSSPGAPTAVTPPDLVYLYVTAGDVFTTTYAPVAGSDVADTAWSPAPTTEYIASFTAARTAPCASCVFSFYGTNGAILPVAAAPSATLAPCAGSVTTGCLSDVVIVDTSLDLTFRTGSEAPGQYAVSETTPIVGAIDSAQQGLTPGLPVGGA